VGPGWWALITAVAAGVVGGVGGFLGSLLAHRDSDLDRAATRYAAAQVALATDNERAHELALIDLRELVRGKPNGVYRELAKQVIEAQYDQTEAQITEALKDGPGVDVVQDDERR